MEIKIPTIQAQQRFIFEQGTREGIRQLEHNLNAPVVQDLGIDEGQYNLITCCQKAAGIRLMLTS